MIQNIQLEATSETLMSRLHLLSSNRVTGYIEKSQKPDLKFRMIQRIMRPANSQTKKIKSQTVSPEPGKTTHTVGFDHRSLRKNTTQTSAKNGKAPNQSETPAGRAAALGNHSPQKIKIKTTGLIPQSISTSIQKSSSRSKYIINPARRKFSYEVYETEPRQRMDSKLGDDKREFTQFQSVEIKKYQIYYRGIRKIYDKSDVTDLQGNPIIQVGDSIAYRYQILQEIGHGAFGKVYKCKDHKKNQIVALKVIKAIAKLNKQAKIQIQILQKAISKDPDSRNNIVRIKGSFIFRGHSCITYQMLSINLYEYLKINRFKGTPEPILVKFAIQILHSLNFLHQNKIVHCDIKPQNIMLKQAHKTGLKLIDMGSSCYEDSQFYTYIQSRFYRAPEVILGIKYTTAIDMWSFGCVLAQMLKGYPLFPGESQEEQLSIFMELLGYPPIHMLEQGTRRKRFFNDNLQCRIVQAAQNFRIPKGISFQKKLENYQNKLLIDFIKKCIQWDPNKRITPKQALLHEWVLSGIPANIRARHIVEVTGEGINF